MTHDVFCPTCLARMDLEKVTTEYVRDENGVPKLLADDPQDLLGKFHARFRLKRCPDSRDPDQASSDPAAASPGYPEPHYWPSDYMKHNPPLVIGFVGTTGKGKSHLLAAMIGSIQNGGLESLGLTVEWIDRYRHEIYMNNCVYPFIMNNKDVGLTCTLQGKADYVDVFMVSRDQYKRVVIFYDVAGGDLENEGSVNADFIFVVDSLIFVVDIGRASKEPETGDRAFRVTIDKVKMRSDAGITPPGSALPIALVLTKADECQFDIPVTQWMRKNDLAAYHRSGGPDLKAIEDESRHAYGYLYKRGFGPSLEPVRYFDRATLHFASATGSRRRSNDETSYPRGVRPCRVLNPLAAIFTMTGVLGENEMTEIGR